MLAILSITLPIYLIIATGYVAVRLHYIDDISISGLSRFTVRVSLPALIFGAIVFSGSNAAINWGIAGGYLFASMVLMTAGYLFMHLAFGEGKGASWIHGLGMAQANSGFIGYAIASMVFPDTALAVLAWLMIIENTVVIPFAIVAADLVGNRGSGLSDAIAKAWRSFSRNPLVIAVTLALVVRFVGISIPQKVETTIRMFASAAPVVALFVVGGMIAQYSISPYWRRTATITFGKLIVHPLLVYVVLGSTIGWSDPYVLTAVLFASVSMLTIYPILGAQYGAEQVSATALVTATCVSFFTVSALIWAIQTGLM
ncbi:AEC family transporter [Loktanella sp. IMCC34160]|uniref:AEC family transporter n=1 Tax=Loktanella sp. IMCC34160 TaxID=2510646 RepID=UPI0013EB9C4B|nr:AEC family transporter [Loktanella sp. IMCC34160]